MAEKKFNALPGFGLTMGFTVFYLSAIVLIPIAGLFLKTLEISPADFWRLATTDRALAAYELTFGASLVAALANALFGTILAWVLVRYEFPGKRFIDALVDFPFALPTAVAGLTLANLFAGNLPFKTEIAPYLIVMRLEEYDYTGAVALAIVLMVISFATLYIINWLENWSSRFQT